MKKLLALLFTICLLMAMTGCSQISEGDYEKVDKKLKNYIPLQKYTEARILMEENPWYTVKDKEIAQKLLNGFDKYRVYEETWLPVIARIDGNIGEDIISKKDDILFEKGLHHFDLDDDDAREDLERYWANCSEGSKGRNYYLSFSNMLDGEYLESGKLIADSLKEEEIRNFEEEFFDYHEKTESPDLEDFLGRMYYAACISNIAPAPTTDQFKAPAGDYSPDKEFSQNKECEKGIYEHFKMPEKIRNTLTKEFTEKANGNKVLILNRIARLSEEKTDLYINGHQMRSLPAEYCAESIADVGYILLIDYGYIKDGIWYAGTAKATVYDVKNMETIFTSKEDKSPFDQYYFGEETDYIFSYYPGVTDIIKESLEAINERT